MCENELKELIRLFWKFNENKSKETGHELKYFLKHCDKQIKLKELKSELIKFK